MKFIGKISILSLAVIILSSCNIMSLNPFYNSSNMVFKQELLGHWMDNSGKFEITLNKGMGGSYSVLCVESGISSRYNAILFKIKDQYFFDVSPACETGKKLYDSTVLGCHILAKCSFNEEQVKCQLFSSDYFSNPSITTTPLSDKQLITSSTSEIISYLEKNLDKADPNSKQYTMNKIKTPTSTEPKTSGAAAGGAKAS